MPGAAPLPAGKEASLARRAELVTELRWAPFRSARRRRLEVELAALTRAELQAELAARLIGEAEHDGRPRFWWLDR